MISTCSPDQPDHPGGQLPAEATEVAPREGVGATPAPAPLRRLHGRNVGVLIGDPAGPPARTLRDAAEELGARVALAKFQMEAPADDATLQRTAHVLARLYDVVVCVDLPAAVTDRLREVAGIPLLALDAFDCDAVEGTRERLLAHLANQWP
jgi:hypothetical protein